MQIRSNCLLFYQLNQETQKRSTSGFINSGYKILSEKAKEAYSGEISEGSKKRIKRAVDILVQICPARNATNPVSLKKFKHSLSFITLTIGDEERYISLSEAHTKLLAPFIRIMKEKSNMITYIWKAEYQKNSSLHYHITTPSVIHFQKIKDCWNNLRSINHLLDGYHKNNPGQRPNSTDIHSVYKKEDISWYMCKEITKNVQSYKSISSLHTCTASSFIVGHEKIKRNFMKDQKLTLEKFKKADHKLIQDKGKIWDCSLNLKGLKYFSMIEPSNLTGIVDEKKIKWHDQFGIYNINSPGGKLPRNEKEEYNNWRLSILKKQLY